ncbi:hypothetical protein BC939DRAFT_477556 [Gamsiella multidivaricata]|uniref:uncharacterized protein n=1 Tax=Gamsiella multidivaricata TaxID=101098 RepID=UPI002220125E|nr:uncharacterized protein BC939DRAFT_477556 [Gamsiella multidivaricata]KAI7822916.1 hypothetical protein BC939DRAFT_477556 [Gamsiella multidivaricata]
MQYEEQARECSHNGHNDIRCQPMHIYRATRRSSQPSYVPDHRGRLSTLLNAPDPNDQVGVQDQESKQPPSAVDSHQVASGRESGGASSKNAQLPSMGSSSSSSSSSHSRPGTRGSGVGGMVSAVSPRGDSTGSRTQFHAPLEPEVVAKLDDVFFKFLQRICSDLNACDAKGDHIHQPLMAKKMQRLEASTDFRPFKFRIQAFTNAFHDDLVMNGLTEDILPLRKVKLYLWKHRYISRFNEDGKKQKSKGNHVWNIEARKILNPTGTGMVGPGYDQSSGNGNRSSGSGDSVMDLKGVGPEAIAAAGGGLGIVRRQTSPVRWEFREYSSRIAGQVIKFARVGVPYVYSPRIWDAQMSCPAAKFSSPWLPGWLKWHKGELKGIPGPEDESCTITVIAEYVREGEECRLEMSFPLTVSDPSKEGELMDSQNEHEDEDELDEQDYDDRDHQQDPDRVMETDSGGGTVVGQHSWHHQRSNQHQHHHHHHQQQYSHVQVQLQQQHQQTQHQQTQHQLQQLHLQERPLSLPHQQQQSGSEDELGTSDEPQDMGEGEDDMDEDGGEDGTLCVRKQSRERRSLILTQETKRRKHD